MPCGQILYRRVTMGLDSKCGQSGLGRAIPDNVEDDAGKGGVGGVAVGIPVGGQRIDLDIASGGQVFPDLNDSLEKIRAGFVIQESGVEDAQWMVLGGLQGVATQALMLPDGLQ